MYCNVRMPIVTFRFYTPLRKKIALILIAYAHTFLTGTVTVLI